MDTISLIVTWVRTNLETASDTRGVTIVVILIGVMAPSGTGVVKVDTVKLLDFYSCYRQVIEYVTIREFDLY